MSSFPTEVETAYAEYVIKSSSLVLVAAAAVLEDSFFCSGLTELNDLNQRTISSSERSKRLDALAAVLSFC